MTPYEIVSPLDPAFGHWLAGLTDGEGCFWIHKQKGGAYYAPQFKIKLRSDDRPVLEYCQAMLGGAGNLYDHDASTGGGRNNAPAASWMLQSRADSELIAAVFTRFPLRAKKARDFAIWRQAVVLRTTMTRGNRWHGPRDWAPLLALKSELEAGRRYKEKA